MKKWSQLEKNTLKQIALHTDDVQKFETLCEFFATQTNRTIPSVYFMADEIRYFYDRKRLKTGLKRKLKISC